jgi:hypothetical protein
MNIVIYTVLTGSYEKLIQPRKIDPDFRYICFSDDNKVEKDSVWEYRSIPYCANNKQILSRYPKMHPHLLLDEFDYSVYIDANVQILDDTLYKKVKQLASSNERLAGMKHQEVSCAYVEGLRIYTIGKERNIEVILDTLRFLRRENFPYNYGMYEANVIFRNHHDSMVIKQCELWWDCYSKYVKRDQVTYPYTLWKCGIPFTYILPENYSANNHPGFYVAQEGHGRPKSKIRTFFKHILYPPTLWCMKRYVELTKNKIS